MQNAAASNTTADNLAVLIDMGFSEEQSKEVKYIDEYPEKHFIYLFIYLGFTSSRKFRRCNRIST
jgi:hypothetical protein